MDHLLISLGHDARTITSVGKDASRSMKKLVLNDNTETESTMKLSVWDRFGWIDNLVTKIVSYVYIQLRNASTYTPTSQTVGVAVQLSQSLLDNSLGQTYNLVSFPHKQQNILAY